MTMSFPRLWALIMGYALTVFGIVGLLAGVSLPVLGLTPAISVVYLITGLVSLFFAYYLSGAYTLTFDRVVGFLYVALAIAGFAVVAAGARLVLGLLPVAIGVNVLNLAVGVISLIAGFAVKEMREVTEKIEERTHRAA